MEVNMDVVELRELLPVRSELTGSVPESFALAFDEFKRRDEAHDGESIRSAFKVQEAWSNLQKELIAWVEREQNASR